MLEVEETYLKEKNKRKINQKLRHLEDTVFELKRKYTNRKIKKPTQNKSKKYDKFLRIKGHVFLV